MTTATKPIRVAYFAILREHAGMADERIETTAGSAAELYAELSARHGFPPLDPLKVAINDEFCDWDRALHPGDTVVFIPPVAGG